MSDPNPFLQEIIWIRDPAKRCWSFRIRQKWCGSFRIRIPSIVERHQPSIWIFRNPFLLSCTCNVLRWLKRWRSSFTTRGSTLPPYSRSSSVGLAHLPYHPATNMTSNYHTLLQNINLFTTVIWFFCSGWIDYESSYHRYRYMTKSAVAQF